MVVDLERRAPIDLLPDREPATLAAWLQAHPAVINGSGSAGLWRPCTPAMAAGLTNHVRSRKEVLLYRVPPWPQPDAR
jgi:hypothetical protein